MSKKRKKPTKSKSRRHLGDADIQEVRIWFQRIFVNSSRAVTLANRMDIHELNESNDLFWALAKYAENVQESITQLDNVNKQILPCLAEVPEKSPVEGDTSWADLKGMRARLAHQFWNIDPSILLATVMEDFPKLIALLSTLKVVPNPLDVDAGHTPAIEFMGSDLISLGMSSAEFPPQPGKSLLCLWFDLQGEPYILRIAYRNMKTLMTYSSHPAIGTFEFYKKEADGWRGI